MKGKAFIVGGTGYIGYHISKEFAKRDYEVTALSFDEVPAGFLPDKVKVIKCNIDVLSDQELTDMMRGHEYFVFAAGLDDRFTPKAPSFPVFYKANVESIKRLLPLAKKAGIKKAIICNSYFAYFDRIWPEMHLSEKHPYIKSRKLQREEAFKLGGKEMPVAILELPYIIGTTPTKGSLWKPLVKYVTGKSGTVFYTPGGTAVISVRNVGEAAVNALERITDNIAIPIADRNMTWEEWLLALRPDKSKTFKVKSLPKWILKVGVFFLELKNKLAGKEGGLSMVSFVDLQARNTFVPIDESKAKLGYGTYDFDQDMQDTVELCVKLLKQK